jgi:hypothetical protein
LDAVPEILPDIVDEADRLLTVAEERGVALRLLGGVAVRLRASDGLAPPFRRSYRDLDFVTSRRTASTCARLLAELGYEPHVAFNALQGKERLLFFDVENERQVDVFVGVFRMSHSIPLEERLELEPVTVPLAELLLTKLQIAELNQKDVGDSLALLHGHPVEEVDGDSLNAARVAAVVADDWGLWRTFTGNLAVSREQLPGYDLPAEEQERVVARIDALTERIDAEPKSRAWKLRARIGERKRWYETPEEVAGGP